MDPETGCCSRKHGDGDLIGTITEDLAGRPHGTAISGDAIVIRIDHMRWRFISCCIHLMNNDCIAWQLEIVTGEPPGFYRVETAARSADRDLDHFQLGGFRQ